MKESNVRLQDADHLTFCPSGELFLSNFVLLNLNRRHMSIGGSKAATNEAKEVFFVREMHFEAKKKLGLQQLFSGVTQGRQG